MLLVSFKIMCIQGGCTENPVIISLLCENLVSFVQFYWLSVRSFHQLLNGERCLELAAIITDTFLGSVCLINVPVFVAVLCLALLALPSLWKTVLFLLMFLVLGSAAWRLCRDSRFDACVFKWHSFLFVHIFVCILSVSRMQMIELCFLKESHFTISAF